MRLHSATFMFDEYSVFFCGDRVELSRHAPGAQGWVVVTQMNNPWTNRGSKENDGVMGRKWKPRGKDAERLVKVLLDRVEEQSLVES